MEYSRDRAIAAGVGLLRLVISANRRFSYTYAEFYGVPSTTFTLYYFDK